MKLTLSITFSQLVEYQKGINQHLFQSTLNIVYVNKTGIDCVTSKKINFWVFLLKKI